MDAIIADLVAEIEARGPPKDDDMSIAARLMRLTDPQTGGPLSQARKRGEVGAFFVAGSETTGKTLGSLRMHVPDLRSKAEQLFAQCPRMYLQALGPPYKSSSNPQLLGV